MKKQHEGTKQNILQEVAKGIFEESERVFIVWTLIAGLLFVLGSVFKGIDKVTTEEEVGE